MYLKYEYLLAVFSIVVVLMVFFSCLFAARDFYCTQHTFFQNSSLLFCDSDLLLSMRLNVTHFRGVLMFYIAAVDSANIYDFFI